MDRDKIAKLISNRLTRGKELLKQQYDKSKNKIGYFYIDNLLPAEIVNEIDNQFPYQNIEVVNCIKHICGIENLQPDEYLYAGGISSMKKNQFLNPHLDNSHDKDRNRWRVLNLLYYVTPNWNDENGGHLELWPNGLKKKQITLYSKFNRLVVMATHQLSWHSVSPVLVDSYRNCVSNYYFSNSPLRLNDKFHVTTFRGRPEQIITNQILKTDSFLRMSIRRLLRKGLRKIYMYTKRRINFC
ncbi:MAG: 2OG-Fe(II) oxygenase [Flavobacteriaceae bacterium]|nr:MAG: 2OG-Fe(II) oxygenase [Flavobacteriaceae bacterium]